MKIVGLDFFNIFVKKKIANLYEFYKNYNLGTNKAMCKNLLLFEKFYREDYFKI